MAYNSKDETQIVVRDIIKSNADVIRVSKVINKSGEHIDIRRMYKDENDELQFTSKGIRIRSGLAADLIDAINAALSATEEAVAGAEEHTDETDQT